MDHFFDMIGDVVRVLCSLEHKVIFVSGGIQDNVSFMED